MNRFNFGKINKILFAIGIILTIIGYFVMSTGDNVISPILLVVAYVIVIPMAILYKGKKAE